MIQIVTVGFKEDKFLNLKKKLEDIAIVDAITSIDKIISIPDFIIYYPLLDNPYTFLIKESIQIAKYINEVKTTQLLLISHQLNYKNLNFDNPIHLDKPVLIEQSLKNICKVCCIRIPQIISTYPNKLIKKNTFFDGLIGLNYNIQFVPMDSLAKKIKIIIKKPFLKKNYVINGCYCTTKDLYYEVNKYILLKQPILYIPMYFIDLYEKYIQVTSFNKWKSIPDFYGKCHHKLHKIVNLWLGDSTTHCSFLLDTNKTESSIQELSEMPFTGLALCPLLQE